MPREKDFNKDSVIKKCISLFASNGYNATGIQEIVSATGINRSSLYSTFNGKDNLFLICLQIAAQEEKDFLEDLYKKSSGIKFVDAYLAEVAKDKPLYHLFKSANSEFKLLNKKNQGFITAHNKWKHEFLTSVIAEGQKSSKISKKSEASDVAGLLEIITQGLQNISASKMYASSLPGLISLLKKKHK